MKSFLLSFLFSLSLAQAQNCQTSQGINLAVKGSYENLHPRDQGSVGTCYVHSASDLLSSYLGTTYRLNVYDASIANDTEADGGRAADVLDSIIKRGWACIDRGQFSNLFPSQHQNIISELSDAMLSGGIPVFYSIDPYSKQGAERQKRIAEHAGKLANKEIVACGPYRDAEVGVEEFRNLTKEINAVERKIKTLEDEKDPIDGWFGTRETEAIDKEIAAHAKKQSTLKMKAELAHKKYREGSILLQTGKNNLDNLSIQEAGEIVYYWAEKTHPAIERIFKKYGLESFTPTMKEFIIDKVRRDPVTQYKYAGGMYPYKLISKVMERNCTLENRIKIPYNIQGKTLSTSRVGSQRIGQQIDSLLQKNPRQGLGISVDVNILQKTSGNLLHAVNIMGCRTVGGVKEYLIHNSWGSGCNNYHQHLRSKCESGRVWIKASSVLNAATEIQWIDKK